MTVSRTLAATILLIAALVPSGPRCQQPADAGSANVRLENLLDSGKYEEALGLSDKELKENPDSPDLSHYRVKALMGLGRFMEAARIALPLAGKYPGRPEFRFLAGQCALDMGLVPQAVKTWSALYTNKGWADVAYRRSAKALLAVGQEAEAIDLLKEALARIDTPSTSLLQLYLSVNDEAPEGLKTLDRLARLDPANKADYEALKPLYAAAGKGRLFEETFSGEPPVTIPLKEKSEFNEISSLTWGSGDIGTTGNTASSKVVVPVSANGSKNRWMLFDSGSDTVLISPYFAKELGLKPVATGEYRGLGTKGALQSNWVLIESLAVGPVTIKNVPALIIDKGADFFKEVGGILPLSLFRHHPMLYDWRHGKLVLYGKDTRPEEVMGKKTFTVKTLWFDERPFVETTINDHSGLYCLLDTGSYTTFIAEDKIGALGITINSSKYKNPSASGLSGAFHSGVAEGVKMIVGKTLFNMPTVQVTDIGGGYEVDPYGILGRNVLDLFKIYFDYGRNVVAFEPYD